MKVKLVEVVKDGCGSWKGTWYKAGDLVYVTINRTTQKYTPRNTGLSMFAAGSMSAIAAKCAD